MLISVEIFSLLYPWFENLLRCKTKTLGNLKIVIYFSTVSIPLHLEHLYPHLSIYSGFTNPFIKSSTSTLPNPLDFGIETLKSIKLSKVKLMLPHFLQLIELQSWPSNISEIIESSLSLKYLAQISDYLSWVSLSQSMLWYLGCLETLFNSLCIPSKRHLRNS